MGITRRSFLAGSALSAAGGALASALPRSARASGGRDLLVCVFLRGGLDALSALVPYRDPRYYERRPTIAIPASQVIDLDGQLGLHPSLAPLGALFESGALAVVQAAGVPGASRDHVAASEWLELGGAPEAAADGWLARHLDTLGLGGPLPALAFGSRLPGSLRGARAVSLPTLGEAGLRGFRPSDQLAAERAIRSLHAGGVRLEASLGEALIDALDATALLEEVDPLGAPVQNGATYPQDELGTRLRGVAGLARAREALGLEVVCVDVPGFDTHVDQGDAQGGVLSERLGSLAGGLHALVTDLGGLASDVTVLVVSEFGRQVHENAGGGTDHGDAGLALVLGGGVRGGVYGSWPGLEDADLSGFSGLRVTTDLRDLLCEILLRRLGRASVDEVFPGFVPATLELLEPRLA